MQTAAHISVASRFVNLFEKMQRVPEGYIRGYCDDRIGATISTIEGLYLGLRLTAEGRDASLDDIMAFYRETYERVQHERGWGYGDIAPPVKMMRQKGLSEQRIAAEIVALELETWRRLAAYQTH